MEKIDRNLLKLVKTWIKWSLEKQDVIFQATARNRRLF